MTHVSKICQRCGRVMEWRKKWEKNWNTIRYCSAQCRRAPLREVDRHLETAILELLKQRSKNSSICPSDAARTVREDDWRSLMEQTRMAARRLVSQGLIDIKQGGRIVDPSTAKGPIRLTLNLRRTP